MKKTYQNPYIVVVDVKLQKLMTTSSIPFDDPVDYASGAEARGTRFSRRYDFIDEWDEFEDE